MRCVSLSLYGPRKSGLVSVVDDDDSVRRGLCNLLRSMGYEAHGFASGQAFLQSPHLARTGCLLLDVVMASMSGPQLQRQLHARGQRCPIVFITAYVDAATEESVRQAGAIGFLCKPFSEDALTVLIDRAFADHGPA
jgi:FixJ family two-component response regulator